MGTLPVLIVGAVLTLAGYFGPEDGGTLELFGLILVSIAIWKSWAALG